MTRIYCYKTGDDDTGESLGKETAHVTDNSSEENDAISDDNDVLEDINTLQ